MNAVAIVGASSQIWDMRSAVVVAFLAVVPVAFGDPAPKRVAIAITRQGFEPDRIAIAKDQELALAFTRKTDATCAKEVVIDLGDGKKITKQLPLDQTVEVRAVFHKTGELRYACAMDMVHGVFVVQ